MSRYLEMVDNPSHVKKLTQPQLTQLAEEIRHELITKLSKHGGHLGPNLGGKGFAIFVGEQDMVEAALAAAESVLTPGLFLGRELIPRPHGDMLRTLFSR